MAISAGLGRSVGEAVSRHTGEGGSDRPEDEIQPHIDPTMPNQFGQMSLPKFTAIPFGPSGRARFGIVNRDNGRVTRPLPPAPDSSGSVILPPEIKVGNLPKGGGEGRDREKAAWDQQKAAMGAILLKMSRGARTKAVFDLAYLRRKRRYYSTSSKDKTNLEVNKIFGDAMRFAREAKRKAGL